ncbi:MAG: sugar ABC transporter permease [Anaerolineae bacterium]|nr:sugar ABC transporter permease [Anaerolineae bacterium]
MTSASVPQSNTTTRSWFPRNLWDNERAVGVMFLLPAVLYIVLLVGLPFLIAILFSVSDVTVGDTSLDFVGTENFSDVATVDGFQYALANSFKFTIISQIGIIIMANILAVILTQQFRGKWFVRFLLILPWATPVALGTIGWLWFFDSAFSPIDWVLREVFGLLGPGTLLGPAKNIVWLGKPELAQFAVILVQVWRMTPLAAVILMAGLTSIPQDILDQAEVDGSRFFRTLFRVKLPMILPIMIISLLFSTIFTFGDMTVVFILTRGGPVYYTQILPTWSFFVGIQGGDLGQGAAIAMFLFPLLLAVAVVMLRIARRTEVN